MPLRVTLILLMCFAVSGCSRDSELRNTLGDHQYLGQNPKLTVQVLKKDLIASSSEYGTPKLRLTGIVRQEGDFPVKHYSILVFFEVVLGARVLANGFPEHVSVKDGSAAFSVDISLYGLEKGEKARIESDSSLLKLRLKDFNWWPHRDGLASVTLQVP